MSLVPLRLMASFVCSVTMLFALDAVTVDANGNMVLGTDPQAGDSEILRTEGVLRAANVLSGQTPVAISAATTLTATAFGNWHLISGTSADYTITLPAAAGNQGKCLGVRVLDATQASKSYTIAAAGSEKIDGAASVALTANAALVLMSDGSQWARIGGTATGSGSGGSGVSALTDWQDYTPVFTGMGTVANVKACWRRVGDTLSIRASFTTGTCTTTTASFTLPGVSIDFTKTAQRSHAGWGQQANSGNIDFAVLTDGSVATDKLYFNRSTNSAAGFAPEGGTSVFYNSTANSFEVTGLPVVGWSGTQVVQQGSRFLWAQRYAATATRVTTTPSAPGQYRARRIGVDTAPASGPTISDGVRIDSGSGIAAGRINRYDIYVGPGKVVQLIMASAVGRTGSSHWHFTTSGSSYLGTLFGYDSTTGVASVQCTTNNAGDSVLYSLDSATWLGTGYFDLLIADDPVPVALAPTVHVEASSDAGQSVTAGVTALQYEDEAVDTHGAWSGTVFSAPVAGTYTISAAVAIGASTNAIEVWQNGVLIRTGSYAGASTTESVISFTKSMSTGETLEFRSNNSGTRSSFAYRNWLSITRVGN